jgi:hypothetical protein
MKWTELGGRAEVTTITIASAEDPPLPITSTLMRQLNVGSAIDGARSDWAPALKKLESTNPLWAPHAQAMTADRSDPAGGRPSLSSDELTKTARLYVEALRAGVPTGDAVAAGLHLTPSGAAKRIRKARDAGLLPPTPRSRAAAPHEGEDR